MSDQLFSNLHAKVIGNAAYIRRRRQICGCFYCREIFDSEEISDVHFAREKDGRETAHCPFCDVDAVVCEEMGATISPKLILEMNERYF